ncbi:hypothetical protein [Microbacterium sp.]|uniref:hypothetical protein n=1 Tax=Microbacterium sp. TaxID=51671 RepID=UPI0037C7F833
MVERASTDPAGIARTVGRGALAALLIGAGVSHLTWGRRGYRIVVPEWATRMLRLDKDAIVIGSGVVEVMLGAALVVLPRERRRIGAVVAAFFVAVFPGNVHQWRTRRPAPLMRTDRARFIRLLLQPALVAWALWSTPSPSSPSPSRPSPRSQKGRR